MKVDLPFPPSVNHYYRRVGVRTLISREGRNYREAVCLVLSAMGVRPLSGPLRVKVHAYPPDNRRRDLDNLLKSLLDALQHGKAYHDDSQIEELSIERRAVERPYGCVEVFIEEAV